MSDLVTRNTPVYYVLCNVEFSLDSSENVKQHSNMIILNAAGQPIDRDCPERVLPDGQYVALENGQTVQLNMPNPILLLIDGPVTIQANGPVEAWSGEKPVFKKWMSLLLEAYESQNNVSMWEPQAQEL